MSKTFNKTVKAVGKTLSVIPSIVGVAQLNIGEFREAFNLTSMGKAMLAKTIEDALTLSEIVDQYGAWAMAEIQHPVYQLNRVDPQSWINFVPGRDGDNAKLVPKHLILGGEMPDTGAGVPAETEDRLELAKLVPKHLSEMPDLAVDRLKDESEGSEPKPKKTKNEPKVLKSTKRKAYVNLKGSTV